MFSQLKNGITGFLEMGIIYNFSGKKPDSYKINLEYLKERKFNLKSAMT
jgi:hypothetical protein